MKALCKKCGGHVSYDPEQYGGKVIDCPHCSVKLRLPANSPKQKQRAPFLLKSILSSLLGFALIGVLGGGICLGMYWLCVASPNTQTTDKPGQSASEWNWSKLIPSSFKEVEINGTLYVKLNSGETVPLSMVKVAIYEEGFISNKMATINTMIRDGKRDMPAKIKAYKEEKKKIQQSERIDELKSEVTSRWQTYQTYQDRDSYQNYQRALAAYQMESANGSGEVISQAYKDLIKDPVDILENGAKLKVILDLKVLSLANDEPIWGGAVATVLTDKDGKFHFTLPGGGDYALFAVTSRRSLAGQERFVFFRRLLLKSGCSYPTVDLDNSHEKVSDYTSYWSKETRNEKGDYDLLKDVLFWLMKGNYGLEDVNPPSQH